MSSWSRRVAALGALAIALSARPARAADPGPADVDARYAAIEASLARGEPAARLWWTGWVSGYAALSLGQGAVALFSHDEGLRIDAAVGGASSLLGFASTALSSRAAFTARSELRAMDASTREARRRRLERAEGLLRDAAEGERFGHSALAQWGSNAVTLTGTFVLWLGYKRYASGWANLLASTAVGELQILTQPTAAIEDWNAYRAGRFDELRSARRSVRWTIAPAPGGLWITGSF